MRRAALCFLGLVFMLQWDIVHPAAALAPERYTVYCAGERIEISFWDIEQMTVRRGSDVCQFASYSSYSDAIRFVEHNFGGQVASCSC